MQPSRFMAPFLALVGLLLVLRATASSASTYQRTLYLPVVPQGGYVSTPPPTATSLPTSTPSPTPTVSSTSPYSHGSVGYDLSFPACGYSAPPTISSSGAPYSFAVVGVNDGRAFTNNPCFATEFNNAVGQKLLVSFYININAPIGSTAYEGNTGPMGTCASGDDVCLSYNYGYNAAQNANQTATTAIGSTAAAGRVWWLDVETANSWWIDQSPPPSNATALDDEVIQGAIDYFQQNGMTVGSYSISSMWAQGATVGGMAHASGLPLHSQILGNFQPGIPAWTSGAISLSSAPSFCAPSAFTGGPTWLVQEPLAISYDEDYAC